MARHLVAVLLTVMLSLSAGNSEARGRRPAAWACRVGGGGCIAVSPGAPPPYYRLSGRPGAWVFWEPRGGHAQYSAFTSLDLCQEIRTYAPGGAGPCRLMTAEAVIRKAVAR